MKIQLDQKLVGCMSFVFTHGSGKSQTDDRTFAVHMSLLFLVRGILVEILTLPEEQQSKQWQAGNKKKRI